MIRIARNGQRTLSLVEFPNPEIVSDIWRHPDIYQHQVQYIKNYCDAALSGKVKVNYVLHGKFGRFFIKDYRFTSSCAMWSALRCPLFSKTEYDIDIVNCHNCIMYDLMKDIDRYTTDKIGEYVMHRGEIIEDFNICESAMLNFNNKEKSFLSKKDFVKGLFTILLYGGTIETWEDQYSFNSEDWSISDGKWKNFLKEYISELQTNRNIMICDQRFTDIVEEVKDLKLKKAKMKYPEKPDDKRKIKKNVIYFDIEKYRVKPGKILSVILQDYERRIVENAMEWVSKNTKSTITSYNYDGFQILKDGFEDEDILKLNES
jgi:hypothetical protein